MEKFFENNNTSEPNYYELLGCDKNSSIEQISTEFKLKALMYHPDKNLNCDEASKEKFKELLKAKETLCDEDQRRKYDMWLNSGLCMKWDDWINLHQKKQTVFHWVYQKTDPMIEDTSLKAKESSANCVVNELASFRSDNSFGSQNKESVLSSFRNYKI